MLIPQIKTLLGHLGFLQHLDCARMRFFQLKNYQKNIKFKRELPDFALPNDQIIYETFRLDYRKYFDSGQETANWLIHQFEKHMGKEPHSILDWGCGPARVVRHLPTLVRPGIPITGSDFNKDTINWCNNHIDGVNFIVNNLDPPIGIPYHSIDFAYAISVFTHLSESRHFLWFEEIHQCLAPQGIFLFTTQGKAFLPLLTTAEKVLFEKDQLVVRDYKSEGRRIFSAFHPEKYIKGLLKKFVILEQLQGSINSKHPDQDVWIVQKK